MSEKNSLMVPEEVIMSKILVVRGVKVMIDSDLAELYGVTTKRLNEQVKRNTKRFPEDFMFRLTGQEKQEVVAICDHLERYIKQLEQAKKEVDDFKNRRQIGF
ncbi:MAG: ORF6N domain-containing protein [Bacteroidetes bacterium]|nr:ORF6N domain-containing protein [Bacteroidota bacterium]